MSFQPHPAQVQALRTAKRFHKGFCPTKVDPNLLPPGCTLKFRQVPSQVLIAEIGHLCTHIERNDLLDDLCDRGYLRALDGYPECLGAPMEYQTEDGATVFVHNKDWSEIDVLRPDAALPDGTGRVQHYLSGTQGHIVIPPQGTPRRPSKRKQARGRGKSGPGRCYVLEPDGYKLLDQMDHRSAVGEGKRDGDENGGKRPKQRGPAWNRLEIIKSDTGNDLARLDGKDHRLTGANDARFLELLQEKQGAPILAKNLESTCGERPARIYLRLPKAIQRIIDKPGQRTGKKGYRML